MPLDTKPTLRGVVTVSELRGPVMAFARAGNAEGSFAQMLRSMGGPSSDEKSAPGTSYSIHEQAAASNGSRTYPPEQILHLLEPVLQRLDVTLWRATLLRNLDVCAVVAICDAVGALSTRHRWPIAADLVARRPRSYSVRPSVVTHPETCRAVTHVGLRRDRMPESMQNEPKSEMSANKGSQLAQKLAFFLLQVSQAAL